MRIFLDRLYAGAAIAAALAIFAIFVLVAIQVLARMADAVLILIGLSPFGLLIPSIAEICGFLLGGASFLALAWTLMRGGHIRVVMLLEVLPEGARRTSEGLIGLIAFVLSLYATGAMARFTWKSFIFNDVSYGIIPVPLALPQAVMTLGLAILTVAILDATIAVWRRGTPLPGGRET
jgi:TRAP-type C4-dicarboxylate transport system permease small subunit